MSAFDVDAVERGLQEFNAHIGPFPLEWNRGRIEEANGNGLPLHEVNRYLEWVADVVPAALAEVRELRALASLRNEETLRWMARAEKAEALAARYREALTQIRDGWKHASDCDVSFGQHEDYCDCYHGVARAALAEDEVKE